MDGCFTSTPCFLGWRMVARARRLARSELGGRVVVQSGSERMRGEEMVDVGEVSRGERLLN